MSSFTILLRPRNPKPLRKLQWECQSDPAFFFEMGDLLFPLVLLVGFVTSTYPTSFISSAQRPPCVRPSHLHAPTPARRTDHLPWLKLKCCEAVMCSTLAHFVNVLFWLIYPEPNQNLHFSNMLRSGSSQASDHILRVKAAAESLGKPSLLCPLSWLFWAILGFRFGCPPPDFKYFILSILSPFFCAILMFRTW